MSIYRKSLTFGQNYFFCEEQALYGSARLGTEQVEHSMRGLVSNDALTDEITRAREQHGDDWQQRLNEMYEGSFYERLQEAWGYEWNTRLDLVLQGNNDGWLIEQIRNESYTLQAGNKRFELSNHLGNVLAVVSDKKEQSDGVTWSAVVVSVTDYFPFGMAMPERSSGAYRYGFNGKETDPETGIQDYGMRWYLPNIARFPSVDPLTHDCPWYTPYQFAGNMPIVAIDLDGAEPTFPHQPSVAIFTIPVVAVVGETITGTTLNPNTAKVTKTTFNYVEQSGNQFSNADVWRMEQLFSINHNVRQRLKAAQGKAYKDGNRYTKGLCGFDCITIVIEATKLLYNNSANKTKGYEEVPIPGNGASMQGWLRAMAVAKLAGLEYTVGFLNKLGNSANKNGSTPVSYSKGTTFSQKLDAIHKAENANVFGVSLFGGYHSLIITREGNGNYTLHDEFYWGVKTYTPTDLDNHILSEAARLQNYEGPDENGKNVRWKDHYSLNIEIRAFKPISPEPPKK